MRRFTGRTDWAAIVQLYDALLSMHGSVVIAVNRAVALASAHGAEAGLTALNELKDESRLAEYQPYWAARAALLADAGFLDEATQAYRRAIGLESDSVLRRFLQGKLSEIS
jgi:RNA polymerase sigma-70 factor (ECF subfamily)